MSIKNSLLKIIPGVGKKLYWGIKMAFYKDSYLVQTGFINSKTSKTLTDSLQDPLPWMPYSIIDFLKERLNKNLTVFEFGSGSSTLFFAKRVLSITSVEYDSNWYNSVNETLKAFDNAKIIFQEVSEEYINKMKTDSDSGKYDIIVIDGRERVKCAKEAITCLTDKGVIIFDDTFRDHYQEGIVFLKENGFKKLTFTGLKPGGLHIDETSIFYKSGNCLGL